MLGCPSVWSLLGGQGNLRLRHGLVSQLVKVRFKAIDLGLERNETVMHILCLSSCRCIQFFDPVQIPLKCQDLRVFLRLYR